ncbi:unnamed protein product [Cuscuta epithymum]|uniref:ATP-dependent DNA helicase n=1 Tax=Cuscuta epithymum TaxID=186058 RepID=A0AAV0CQF6_9ASTE|nr:unnamed protein product [Cuscuta epithymum]
MLDKNNAFVKSFRMVGQKVTDGELNIRLKLIGKRVSDARTYNLPSTSEVAALIVGDFDENLGNRDIVLQAHSGSLQRINELHPAYLPLQYPLLFPYGEDGYREDIPFSDLKKPTPNGRTTISVREYFAFRLHERDQESPSILFSKRLFQQFVVDAYAMVEAGRLRYVRTHQQELRCELYKGLSDAILRGETDSRAQGKRVILPSTFTGGARYMIQNYQDAMAICRWAGYPNLFITFTCNPKWSEISRFLEERRLKPEDRADIICRIFKVKLDGLIKDLRDNKIFGRVKAVIYTIEFQKRGLPHAHILLFIARDDPSPFANDIDRIISAEIPDKNVDPVYYDAVADLMMHGPCGPSRPNSPCMSNGRCTKHFPKKFNEETTIDDEGYPIYRRRDDGRTITKGEVELTNQFVVPHNRYLLLKYGAHMNVEWCNQSRSIKYLFKYVNKGNDRVTAAFYQNPSSDESNQPVDEIKMYYDCRYVSPCEAAWRILGFEIQYRNPAVERLSLHLPGEQNVYFSDTSSLQNVVDQQTMKESMFVAWFKANKKYPEAKNLTYVEFPQKFVWHKETKEWKERKKGFSIGRINYVPPGSGEIFYMRCLMNVVRGATCHDDLKIVDDIQFLTYRDACYERGLLDDDREYIDAIEESSHSASAFLLRYLFTTILTSNCASHQEHIWEKCWTFFSDDILYKQRRLLQYEALTLDDDEIKNLALIEIERLLQSYGRSLKDYYPMPLPRGDITQSNVNRLICEELRYNKNEMKGLHDSLTCNLTAEQREVYDIVIDAVHTNTGGVFFVYGYGGTGKTFVWKTLSAALRCKGEIVLNVASSGIASLLLPGGRTAHSRFAIPININEDSTCNIKQGSQLAGLIVKCKLIIWDEAPMVHKHCFEALDKTMRDILQLTNPVSLSTPFGGKTIVFGGDFRQILPVIPKGSRNDIVSATINASYLWRCCKVLRLTKNMRLQSANTPDEIEWIRKFAEWIARIGDGAIGDSSNGFATIEIPDDILLKYESDPIATIVRSTYPGFPDIDDDPTYLEKRAILAPTLDVVDSINQYMMSLNTRESKTYFSSDSACQSNTNADVLADVYTPEFLNSLKCSGVPNHELTLKVGTPVMLLRNIDHSMGLCNGTRLVITRLGCHVLEAKILSGHTAGQKVLIPRLNLTPSDVRMPFKFQRRQFPIMVSYAMTINKSQGQSLSHVGLFLKNPVFCHGQLYVAVSRVTRREGLKILICNPDGASSNSTLNVVYPEVFQNV